MLHESNLLIGMASEMNHIYRVGEDRDFHKHTTLAIIPILASEALVYENKKNPVKNVTPSGNRTKTSYNL